jgi:hypothetical protein
VYERRRKGPRIKVECTHPIAKHQHGTSVMYSKDGCRCDPCTDAKMFYGSKRCRQIAYGRWQNGYTDPTEAREHLLALREQGIGYRRVSALTGIAWSTVQRISAGRSPRIKVSNAKAILAIPITPDAHAPGAAIDSTGTRRRVEALLAIGWSLLQIKAHSSVNEQTLQDVLAGRPILELTRTRILASYEVLWDKEPPALDRFQKTAVTKTKRRAAERGYVPPLAWDDETIDDPAAQPMGVRQREKRIHDRDAVIEDMDFLRRQGASPTEAARRIGLSLSGLEQAAMRAGRNDLGSWARNEMKKKVAA